MDVGSVDSRRWSRTLGVIAFAAATVMATGAFRPLSASTDNTPFGTPVVPEVYIWTIVSPASPRPPGSTGSWAASHGS